MSNRDGKSANSKKRDKYKLGKLCPKCGKGRLMHCDQPHKEGHRHHAICKKCGTCNF